MKAKNKVLGDAVCGQVEEMIRAWGFMVHSHEDDPGQAPGDFTVGNGHGTRLFVECKSYRRLMPASGHHSRTYPGRALLTPARHAWLEEEGGFYVFARYRLEEGVPVLEDVRFARAGDIRVPAGRKQWRMPWARIGELDGLEPEAIRRRLDGGRHA